MLKIRNETAALEESLRLVATKRRAEGEKRYLKSDLHFIGATKPDTRRALRVWLTDHTTLSRTDLLRFSRSLWKRRVHELRIFTCLLLEDRLDILALDDLEMLEWMLRHSHSWAYVDALAVHVVGPIVERDPRANRILDRWAQDDDFWIRRSALLALLLALRRGDGDWKRFVRYADGMLDESEFFIRKAIGWILREASKKTPDRVADFLEPRVARASGVTFREAVKYLPEARVATLNRKRVAG